MSHFTGFLLGKVQLDGAIRSEVLATLVETLLQRHHSSDTKKRLLGKVTETNKFIVECSERGLKLTSPGVKSKDEGFESDCESIRSIRISESNEIELTDLIDSLDISGKSQGRHQKEPRENEKNSSSSSSISSSEVVPNHSLSSSSGVSIMDTSSISSSSGVHVSSDDNNSSSGNGSDSDEFGCGPGDRSLFWEPLPNISPFQSYPIEDLVFCHCDSLHPSTLVWVVRHLSKMIALVTFFRKRQEAEELFQTYRELRLKLKPIKYKMKQSQEPLSAPPQTQLFNNITHIGGNQLNSNSSLLNLNQISVDESFGIESAEEGYLSQNYLSLPSSIVSSPTPSKSSLSSQIDSHSDTSTIKSIKISNRNPINTSNQMKSLSLVFGSSNSIIDTFRNGGHINELSNLKDSITSSSSSRNDFASCRFNSGQASYFRANNGHNTVNDDDEDEDDDDDDNSADGSEEDVEEQFHPSLAAVKNSKSTPTARLRKVYAGVKMGSLGRKMTQTRPVLLVPLKSESMNTQRSSYPKESYLYHVMGRSTSTFAPYQRSMNFISPHQYALGGEYLTWGSRSHLVPFSSWLELSEMPKSSYGNSHLGTASRKISNSISKNRIGSRGHRNSSSLTHLTGKGTSKILLRDSSGPNGMWSTLSQRFKRNFRDNLMTKLNGMWPNAENGQKKKPNKKVTFNAWATVQMV